MNLIKANAKAIVAVLVLLVAALGSALGVETGIDVQHWWNVLGLTLVGGLSVWAVPNRPDSGDGERDA